MTPVNRRSFLKSSGLSIAPALLPALPVFSAQVDAPIETGDAVPVQFIFDGEVFDAPAYWQQLEEAHKKSPVHPDRYGMGGAVEELEKKFAALTGKEKAIYMPSGTMANQFAIAVLSGEKTKVYVQDTSHVYRDEADAAQSVFNKRLIPLAKDQTFFSAEELKQSIENRGQREVFDSGTGCVSVENPVRRRQERIVPLEEIKKISAYCRDHKIGLHLDGARIYLASAWSGVPVKEYASYFDTVYISLYKYLGASGGAILCGDSAVIDKMPHLIKIHGGNMYGNWLQAAMALHRLDGLEERLQEAIKRATIIFKGIEPLGVKVRSLEGGSNIYFCKLPDGRDPRIILKELAAESIYLRNPDTNNEIMLAVNESLLHREPASIIDAFSRAIKKAG